MEEKKPGFGRGNLLKFLQEKKESESQLVAQSSLAREQSTAQSNVPSPVEVPTTSVKSLGRGSILKTLQSLQTGTTGPTGPTPIPVLKPVQPVPLAKPATAQPHISAAPTVSSPPVRAQGRGSLLSALQSVSAQPASTPEPAAQPSNVHGSSYDPSGVLGPLSDITLHETTKTISKQGSGGKDISLSANYINVKVDPEKGLYSYEVKYNPEIDSTAFRAKLINQHLQKIGTTKCFDGTMLYLPHRLPQNNTILESVHPLDNSTIKLTLIYKKKQNLTENIPFFNILLGRVMRALNLVRIGQHNFNPKGIHAIPQHKLEVWPGYVTTINEFDGGLKLCIDARHRVMRTETVREIMMKFSQRGNFKEMIVKELIGLSVFTRYNNRTYRVDDIDWNKNPMHVFDKGNEKITLVDYYKYHWSLDIQDKKQPLLVHCAKTKTSTGETQEQLILLVPELCYIASLSDSIRADYKIMKDIDSVTKMSPEARRNCFRHFVQQVNSNDIARDILGAWGLSLEPDVVDFNARVYENVEILFGNKVKFTPPEHKPAEWSAAACRNPPSRTPELKRWYIIYCQKDAKVTEEFITIFERVTKAIGMNISRPQIISLRDDRTESFVHALRSSIEKTVDLVVIVFPSNRTDRYSAVKKVCCVEKPIASQVIISRTISRADKLKSIAEKIALQIICKLGGALWAVHIPMHNCMICGIDVYHSGTGQFNKGSVAGFVASMDKMLTTWHSKVYMQGKHQEVVDMLQLCLASSVRAYQKHNNCFPNRVIVYRDGVGEGQLDTVAKYEVKQMQAALNNLIKDFQVELVVIVVHKRINTRVFQRIVSFELTT
ncbi:piwi-like protein Ago3 isoform X2 [Ceratina calcarata]|uniref:Piwi-like protein Ago3 isoform X2 n=1 Tax=Ceratina calcarata TaxID=156304 RepID=A0AAJ7RY91_9HYME|nr:piwi-like protein Ago3 isoform X2 [Ceratina calcarata]